MTLDVVSVAHLCYSHFSIEHKYYIQAYETWIQMNIEQTGLRNLELKFSIKSTFFIPFLLFKKGKSKTPTKSQRQTKGMYFMCDE